MTKTTSITAMSWKCQGQQMTTTITVMSWYVAVKGWVRLLKTILEGIQSTISIIGVQVVAEKAYAGADDHEDECQWVKLVKSKCLLVKICWTNLWKHLIVMEMNRKGWKQFGAAPKTSNHFPSAIYQNCDVGVCLHAATTSSQLHLSFDLLFIFENLNHD